MDSDLDGLAGIAAQADQGAAMADVPRDAVTGEVVEQPVPPSWSEQASDAVNTFAGLICSFAPAAQPIWTDDAKQRSAMVLAPVMEKYGWSLVELPCELTAAIVIGPLLYQSAQIVRDEMAAKRAQKGAAAPAAKVTAPKEQGGETEAPAGGVHPQMGLYQNGR